MKNLYVFVGEKNSDVSLVAENVCKSMGVWLFSAENCNEKELASAHVVISGLSYIETLMKRCKERSVIIIGVGGIDDASWKKHHVFPNAIVHYDERNISIGNLCYYLVRYIDCCEGKSDVVGEFDNEGTVVQVFEGSAGMSTFCSDCYLDFGDFTLKHFENEYESLGAPALAYATLNETDSLSFPVYSKDTQSMAYQFVLPSDVHSDVEEPAKIIVHVEGGIVQSVYTNFQNVTCRVVDIDKDNEDVKEQEAAFDTLEALVKRGKLFKYHP